VAPATKFAVGEKVYVPAARLPDPDSYEHALVELKVLEQKDRSVTVDAKNGRTTSLGSSLVHSNALGLLVLRVGDLFTETGVLDPLSASVHQYFRLLLPDDNVRAVDIRTLTELEAWWAAHHAWASHIVLITHGGEKGVHFLGEEHPVNGADLAERLNSASGNSCGPKDFLALACAVGRAGFAKPFSGHRVCRSLVAPFHPVHGAAASRFAQAHFAGLFLEGRTRKVAFRKAAEAVRGGRTNFRLWTNGALQPV
jgi:hypothetical protein